MKKLWAFLVFFILIFSSAIAQTTLFQFNFENNLNPTIDNVSGLPAVTSNKVGGDLGYSGTGAMCLGGANMYRTQNWSAGQYIQFQVNTTGFANLTFSFCDRAFNTDINNFRVRVSTDGTNWTTVVADYNPGTTNTTRTSIVFPSSCNNVSNVFIQIYKVNAGNTATSYRIDNASLTGYILTNYYSAGNANPNNVNNWWSNTNGTGSHPANFSTNYNCFIVQNGHNMSTTVAGWTVSGNYSSILVRNGGTLTVNDGFNIAETGTDASLVVNSGGTLECGRTGNVTGTAAATIESGANLTIGSDLGIRPTGANGNIQVAGTRNFNSGANYVYNGSAAQATGSGLPAIVNNLTINNAAGVALTNATTQVNGLFSITSGNLDCGNNDLIFNGTTNCGGTLSATNGTVSYNNTALNIITGTYNNLTKNGTSAATACGNIVVNATLTNATTGIIDLSTNTLAGTLSGISNAGTIRTSNTSALPIPTGKTWNGTVEYNGTTQTIVPGTYNTLNITAVGTKTAGGNLTVANLDNGGASNVASILEMAGNTLTATTVENTGGTVRFSGAANGKAINTGIVEYYSAAQSVAAGTYYTLNLLGSGNKTMQGNITARNISIQGTSILVSQQYSITGNAAGTFTMASGTGLVLGSTTNTNNVLFPTNFTTGNITIDNNSVVTYQTNGAQSVSGIPSSYGNLTIAGSGTKTIQNNVRVNGTLNLSNGVLALGASNYNLTIGSSGIITGAFGAGNMIECTGTGFLIKEATTATMVSNLQVTYPVGTGVDYTPMTISSLGATLAGTESISVRVKNQNAPGANTSDLKRYWEVTTSAGISGINANVNFTYVTPGDVGAMGNQLIYQSAFYGGSWVTPAGASADGVVPFSSTGTTTLSGIWTAREPLTTYYSYQSGNWANASTWTTDPSGTFYINPGSSIPSTSSHRAVILNGRTVTTSVSRTVNSLTINEGGILDLGLSTGHDFGDVSGKGKLMLRTGTFPGGTYTNFVSATGGIVEYYNSTIDILLTQQTYNNLIINLDISTRVLYTLADMTINGNLTVTQGNFRISDNNAAAARSDLKIDIKGNVLVSANGSFTVGLKATNTTYLPASFDWWDGTNARGGARPFSTGWDYPMHGSEAGAWVPRYFDIYHKVRVWGDFTNNGTVRLVSTNVSYPNFKSLTQESAATIIFSGTSNNTLKCNGFTDFYNFIIEKGTDQTYVLTVDATRNDYFRLWGRNDMGGGGQVDQGNPEIRKAIWTKCGTLRLVGNTTIASFAEGGDCSYRNGTGAIMSDPNDNLNGPNSDIYIPEKAALVMDGPNVLVLTTADDFREVNYAWGFGAPDNSVYNVDKDGCSSFSIRGKFTINDGYFSARESGGIIFWPGANGTLEMNGGTLDAPQLRSADGPNNALATFIMTGGNIQLRGQYQNNVTGVNSLASLKTVPVDFVTARSGASLQGSRGTFNIAQPSNALYMSGGTITINDVCSGGDGLAYEINANPGNIYVTGGNIIINSHNNNAHNIYTNGAVPNLEIIRTAGTGVVNLTTALPILNNLTITSGVLNSSATNYNVLVGGNFSIAAAGTYTPNANTTSFNGGISQTFNVQGAITNGLNHLSIQNSSSLTLDNANIATSILALGNLSIASGSTLIDNGRTLEVRGNIDMNGIHFKPATGAGSILLSGTAAQIISSDGNGSFNNLSLNKTGGSVTISAAITITGNLRLGGTAGVPARFNIGANKLSFGIDANVYDALTGTSQVGLNNNRMILTDGRMSANGVAKTYNSTTAFVFPFGLLWGGVYYYLPASIQYSQVPTTYGTVTTRPVSARHYLKQSNNSLACYWKTVSTGFTGVPAASVVSRYYFADAGANLFVHALNGESAYIPSVYRGTGTWITINDVNKVDEGNNYLQFDIDNIADGEYTAGEPATFGSIPELFSRTSGNWNDPNTWSTTRLGAAGLITPDANYIVNIVDGFTVTTTADANAGSLYIEDGATLDLKNFTNHNFASLPNKSVTGSGRLRIGASNYFPQSDFGIFIGPDGGTVEYYTMGANIIVPTLSAVTSLPLTTYKNLILTPESGQNITLPDCDLTVYSNLTVTGTGLAATDGVRTPALSHTYTVNGNLNIKSGLLEYRNGAVQTIRVNGNVTIDAGAAFSVSNAGVVVNNILDLYGNLSNNGTFDMNNTGRVLTSFKGTNNATITGTGAIFDFYDLTVNKGNNTTPVVSLQSNTVTTGFTNPFLNLLNGTFRVDAAALTNLQVSTSSEFVIPSTACFSINQGTATIGNGNNNGDLTLYGRLEVLGGTLNIGTGGNFNNDIFYAPAGTPFIYVAGGNLNVNGQIRRSLTNTSGSLNYNQVSGDVVILGENQNVARAKFEITNLGSYFGMSGGTLTVRNDGGTTYGDVYIRPENYSVTGGTIHFGDDFATANRNFKLTASCPLWNVEVGTDAVLQTATLNILGLTVQHDITINGSSVFNASGFNVNIGHDIINENISASAGIDVGGYRAGTFTQTTTFYGSTAQFITGNGANLTNFANLVINSSNTVSLNNNIRVNSNLTLNSGSLADAGNNINLIGNVENNATHLSNSINGGLVFAGTQKQVITGSGSGIFGNIIMGNSTGVDMKDNSRINGKLTFNSGSLYIDDYLLTFGNDAIIGGSPDNTRMIILNGALSDQGVRKIFNSGNSDQFIYHIGVSSKYTPVAYDFSTNDQNNGNITVKSVNNLHQSITNTNSDQLHYYWSVKSSGLGTYILDHSYTYHNDDIGGLETNYNGQRYQQSINSWSNLNPVNVGNNTVNIIGANYVDGEYTAGGNPNYLALPPLYSRVATGSWEAIGTWSTVPGGAGVSCGCLPNGNPVTIESGQSITISANTAKAYSVVLNGTLNVGKTTFHDLGHVSGPGRLAITASDDGMFVFPGGEYDDFLNNTSSIIELTSTIPATLPLKPGNYYKPYNNLELKGAGIKYMSAENLKINGYLSIENGTELNNTLYNKNISILGNFIDYNIANSGFVPGTGLVSFDGTSLQHLTIAHEEDFYNFRINNTNGVVMDGAAGINISNYLYLTRGVLSTTAERQVRISNTSTSAVVIGSASSFIDAPLSKNIISGQSFTFPIGNGTRSGQISLLNTSVASSPQYWTARYNNTNPATPYPTATNVTPLTKISDNEYWVVNRPGVGTANVRLRWDANSMAGYTNTSQARQNLRVVEYAIAGNNWTERSINSGASGSASVGTITTNTPVTADDYIFTIGISGVTAAITNTANAEICNNGESVSIPVTLTGVAPWTLTYRTSGTPTKTYPAVTGIMSPNYTIQLTGTDIGADGVFSLSLVAVSDAGGAGSVNPATKQITVKPTYIPTIVGASTTGASEIRSYNVTAHAGSSYAWTWSGASGGGIASPAANATNITFIATPGTYNLQLVETSSNSCVASDVLSIDIINNPSPSILPVTTNVCNGDVVTYSTTQVGTNSHVWTVVGGSFTIPGADNSIEVTWNTTGAGSVSVDESNGTSHGYATNNVNVSAVVSVFALSPATVSVCPGDGTTLQLANSQTGVSYQLRVGTTNVGTTVAGNTGSAINIPTGNIAAPVTFNVLGVNSGCSTVMTGTTSVSLHTLPILNTITPY